MENRYGIEIELENVRRTDRYGFPSYWVIEGDGSLRNSGMEFKSNKDHGLADAKRSLTYLHDYLTGYDIEAEATPRCGVHVHMDVRDMSHVQIYNLLCNYSMIEPTFFAYVNSFGEDREGSHFCVPYYHTRDRAASLMTAFQQYDLDHVSYYGRKYMALNVLPYLRFGSVEWRQFPSILPVTRIAEWLDILDTFKERSKLGVFSEDEVGPWLDNVFPNLGTEDRVDAGLETYYYHTLPWSEDARPPPRRTRYVRDIDEVFEHLEEDDDSDEPDEFVVDSTAEELLAGQNIIATIPFDLRTFALTHRWEEVLQRPDFRALNTEQRILLLRMSQAGIGRVIAAEHELGLNFGA